ncbi:MAG TPA: hypothetical protein VMA77_28685 [Solirubrobacteraceae bacterium]|nr:hypothetical protein [Solirubrobacteraceae bacterium]
MPIRHPLAFWAGSCGRDLDRDGARAGSRRRFLGVAARSGSDFGIQQRSDLGVARLGFSGERVLDRHGRPGIGGRKRSVLELAGPGLDYGIWKL